VERVYPDQQSQAETYGPTVDSLKSFCWKTRCPSKIRHFLWQILSGCLSVRKNLQTRGMQGDICCARCGAPEESINHVFFECPPAIQTWALSKIPSNPAIFPTESLYANMNHLFWRVIPKMDDHHFAWILWYIWKARNSMVFSNMDIDPRDTLGKAETESFMWADAQVTPESHDAHQRDMAPIPVRPGRWCFSDGSWKANDNFSGQGGYNTLPGFDGLMGARNTRASLSPLHVEFESLIWAMECMRNLRQVRVTFATDCSQLVKMVSEPEEWPAFANYLTDIKTLSTGFQSSEIIYVPRTQNTQADKLARSARIQPSFVVHMDAELPSWLTESI